MRYQKTSISIWYDQNFANLSSDLKLFYFYITTNPHSNLIGFYYLKEGYVREDLKTSKNKIKRWLNELSNKQFISYDPETNLILIKDYLKHNPITNPRQIEAAIKILRDFPVNTIFYDFLEIVKGLEQGRNQGLMQALVQIYNKDLPKSPVSDTDTDTAYKRESDTDTKEVFSGNCISPDLKDFREPF